ncbi:MAG: type I-Fv CRISPR-associated protein Cas5fv [Ghiorsea sp.]|nr:type I-Fv CRISPR-associated protein Cas5fv [Ghiorsea sp.]
MKIFIDYDSSWRNSFLDGNNNESIPQKGRKFIASGANINGMKSKPENFIKREVTHDTVMGLLNRVIGDQRKLYQARACDKYYFKDIDGIDAGMVTFQDGGIETNEMTYIRNITGSTDQNSFTGAIKSSDPMLSSDYSLEFWGVLALDLDSLYAFILDDIKINVAINLAPLVLVVKSEELTKLKDVEKTGVINTVVEKLNNTFPELITDKIATPFVEKNGKVKPVRLYAAALYIQYERLKERFNMTTAMSNRGSISGFSKRGFNGKRDFMNRFTTGKPKTVWGNPYIRKVRVKGVGEVVSLMTKASGQLEITLDISRERAQEIKGMIENAGVSRFFLGKKGLAYISKISTREVR